jgi:hypothetical protein
MANPDLETLLNVVLPFAEGQLAEQGGFHPFGAVLNADGDVAPSAAWTGEEQPDPNELIDVMLAGFRQQAADGLIRAAVVCLDGRVILPDTETRSDAICAQLEHVSGECVTVCQPYTRPETGEVTYGELFAVADEPRIFALPEAPPSE